MLGRFKNRDTCFVFTSEGQILPLCAAACSSQPQTDAIVLEQLFGLPQPVTTFISELGIAEDIYTSEVLLRSVRSVGAWPMHVNYYHT